jgi:hypothetical protein
MKDRVEGGSCGRAERAVLRYARKRGWNTRGLPEHGAILDILARIIQTTERRRMHLGRWTDGFTAVYAAFAGRCRPRSWSRRGRFWLRTRWAGGVRIDAVACLDLLAHEQDLKMVTDAEWDAARKEALMAAKPRDRGRADVPDAADAVVRQMVDVSPCVKLDYCPYGSLAEQFPVVKPGDRHGCARFGHVCPAFIVAERADEARDGSDTAQGMATTDA